MGLLLWPAALLLFLVWSFVAWILYGASDWIAGLIGSMTAGILSADLGPWATWLTDSLGNIVQIGVFATWAIVGLLILALPMFLRRRRREPKYAPIGYEQGYHDPGFRHGGWKDRDAWTERSRYGRAEFAQLRHLARDLAYEYRDKKWKKKKKRYDD